LAIIANEQMINCWWRSGSPSGYRDCFQDLLLLGDTESVSTDWIGLSRA